MAASVAVLQFIGGCVFASFLGVVAHRVPRGEPFVAGRSRCDSCGAEVPAHDNVPVLSWLLLRGRCRSCGERIGARYPLSELGLGALWVATYLILGDDDVTALVLGLALCAVLVTVTLTDLDLRLIPNAVVAAGAIAALAILAIGDPGEIPGHAIAALAAGGGFLGVVLAYPRGMGMGDVKLVAMMGLFLGRAVAPALLVALLAGALVGAVMIARHGAAARKQAIPFGPFLALGGLVGLWFGDGIVDWYLDEFFPSS